MPAKEAGDAATRVLGGGIVVADADTLSVLKNTLW
jgi:hypothetical protein